jgi:hypothetical protein
MREGTIEERIIEKEELIEELNKELDSIVKGIIGNKFYMSGKDISDIVVLDGTGIIEDVANICVKLPDNR